jgi:hypothetical protein
MVYQILKLKESHFYFGKCPTIKLTKIIADTIWIHYAYRRRFMIVKPKKQKEVSYENLTSCKNLDRLPRHQFEKITPSLPTGGPLTNFALILEEMS